MDETRLQRVRFRAWRRGFREADLILGPFADNHARSLSEADFALFEQLLSEDDHDLYSWIIGDAQPPAAYAGSLMDALIASSTQTR